MKQYILPQTEAQIITVSQLMTGSGTTTIEMGDPVPVVPGEGRYV